MSGKENIETTETAILTEADNVSNATHSAKRAKVSVTTQKLLPADLQMKIGTYISADEMSTIIAHEVAFGSNAGNSSSNSKLLRLMKTAETAETAQSVTNSPFTDSKVDTLNIWMFPSLIVDNQYANLLINHATKIANISLAKTNTDTNIAVCVYSFALMKKMLDDRKGMSAIPAIIHILNNETYDERGYQSRELLRTEERYEFVTFLVFSSHLLPYLGTKERKLIAEESIGKTNWTSPEIEAVRKSISDLETKSYELHQNSGDSDDCKKIAGRIDKRYNLQLQLTCKIHLQKLQTFADNGIFDNNLDATLKIIAFEHTCNDHYSAKSMLPSDCMEFRNTLRTLVETLAKRNPSFFADKNQKELFVAAVAGKCYHQECSNLTAGGDNPLHQFVLSLPLKPKQLELFKTLVNISCQIAQFSIKNLNDRDELADLFDLEEKFAKLAGYVYPYAGHLLLLPRTISVEP